MILKPLPDRPIHPITVSIVSEVKRVVDDLRLDTYLVGATASIILLEHVHGLHVGRATRDIDFAFAVENWDQFQAIKMRLISTTKFEAVEGIAQRLKFNAEGLSNSLLLILFLSEVLRQPPARLLGHRIWTL